MGCVSCFVFFWGGEEKCGGSGLGPEAFQGSVINSVQPSGLEGSVQFCYFECTVRVWGCGSLGLQYLASIEDFTWERKV